MKRYLLLTLSIIFALFIICLIPLAKLVRPYLPYVNYLLGVDKPTSYLVLLGNDAEMRANGGFAGSYATVDLNYPNYNIAFQDIYVPNGQLEGLYIAPPDPIQKAFGHGTWELANADWEPDFPSSAKTIRWFMEKGKEKNPDILILLNLSTIKKILNEVGSFSVPEYKASLTPDNLYLFLQGKAELNFFPGSTQKKDALTAVGRALVKTVKILPIIQKLKIAQILYTDFLSQNLLLNSTNPAFQNFLEQQNLAGVLRPEALDTYSLIETNLGANKANAFVTRQTTHQITLSPPVIASDSAAIQLIHHSVIIHFVNSSPQANPDPPFNYGGNYITYLRFYLPADAQNIKVIQSLESSSIIPNPTFVIASDSAAIHPRYGLTELGFWLTTQAGNESTVSLTYDIPLPSNCHPRESGDPSLDPSCPYSLAILKQHGLTTSPQIINLFRTSYTTDLAQSFYFP